MSLPPSAAAVAPEASRDPDRVLLRLLCCIAWSDGEVSAKERELLQSLATEVLLTEEEKSDAAAEVSSLVEGTLGLSAMDALIPQIQGHDQKQLALKLAYMVIRISREDGRAARSTPVRRWPTAAWWKAWPCRRARCRRPNGPPSRT